MQENDMDDVLRMAMDDTPVATRGEDTTDVGEVKTVASMVNRMIALERDIAEMEDRLKDLNAEYEQVRTKELPDAMLEMGVTKWVTDRDGNRLTVSVDHVFYPAVKKEDMPRLVEWLKERGDEGIVKPKFVVDFEKGEVDAAQAAADAIRREHPELDVVLTPDIHWSTFRSYTRDLVTAGDVVLPDFYKYHEANMAKITKRKM